MATESEDAPINIEAQAFEPGPEMYDTAFPALGPTTTRPMAEPVWNRSKFLIKTSTCTQVFTVPMEERRFKEMNEHSFGEEEQQAKICKDIMQKTGVTIEMSLARDQSLTVVIHGKETDVRKARREVMTRLQTQANVQVRVPREYHRFLLGKSGKKLQELELNTATKITIPRSEENSEVISIVGTKEGVDRARHEIQCIADEQAKLAYERLPILKAFHPFICGPNNSIIKQLMEETGAKINIPPPSVFKDEISISGEKEGVEKCRVCIMKIYEEKKRKCQAVSVEVHKSQHKYVIGPRGSGIHEILAETGVSVEVPPLDNPTETITLRGEQDKLGPALTMVYSKANSVVFVEVKAAAWLHRFIIGRKGANVRKITGEFPKVHIEFTEGQDKFVVEGPPEEVEQAVKELETFVKDLQDRMDFAEIEIDQRFHKHIIGKNGVNITRIKNDTGVAVKIPSDSVHSNIIRIEGDPQGVEQAKEELLEMAQRMENEKSRDIIIEQRFHRTIIGKNGEKIREIRERFNQVQVTFPDQGKKSDVVTLRGPKNDVDKVYKYLQNLQLEMVSSNHQAKVHIFKDFHKNIIGKGGNTIRKIREETNTRIDLPSESNESDIITITGKKADVESAKSKIETIQKELANVKEVTIEIPHKLHNSIIGAKGRLIRAIMEECGDVIIRFPPEGSTSDKVTVRGPRDDVENARKQLLELTNEKKESSFTTEVKAKAEYHKFLIGRNGTNIRKVREESGARIIFPTSDDPDQESITIIGRKDCVEKAVSKLEALIRDLDLIIEGELQVDAKHHRHFVARRGEVLRQIADDYGGVIVSFPRSGVKSNRVVLKGAKDCVEGAKKRIQEIVADLDAQVTVECVIPQRYHRTVMGARGSHVQDVTRRYEVGIKFPDRPMANGGGRRGEEHPDGPVDPQEAAMPNGDVGDEAEEDQKAPNKDDIILVTGKPENCEAAKEALMGLVPITEEINIPFDFHRFIIGQKGRDVRRMMEEFDVNISVPAAENRSDIVKVTGPPANVRGALEALERKVEDLEKEKEDRMLRSFKVTIEVDPVYHPKIIGRRGAVITKIRDNHNVNIQFPDKGSPNQNQITITGYEKNAEGAKEDIMKIVKELEEMSTIDVRIDHRVHPRIIGGRGRAVHRIMEDFKVDIRFPRAEDEDPDLIQIIGPEEYCLDCKDHLLNLEEEYLQDVIDQEAIREMQHPPSRQPNNPQKGPESQGFIVKNAPWDQAGHAPDTSSTSEFPTFGAVVSPRPSQAWGPSRRK